MRHHLLAYIRDQFIKKTPFICLNQRNITCTYSYSYCMYVHTGWLRWIFHLERESREFERYPPNQNAEETSPICRARALLTTFMLFKTVLDVSFELFSSLENLGHHEFQHDTIAHAAVSAVVDPRNRRIRSVEG